MNTADDHGLAVADQKFGGGFFGGKGGLLVDFFSDIVICPSASAASNVADIFKGVPVSLITSIPNRRRAGSAGFVVDIFGFVFPSRMTLLPDDGTGLH